MVGGKYRVGTGRFGEGERDLGSNHAITNKYQRIILNKEERDLNLTWKVSLKEKPLEMAFERGFGFMHQILTRKKNHIGRVREVGGSKMMHSLG